MLQTLFEQVKRKLNVTWDDEDTTARIKGIINMAIPDLTHRLGIADANFDFSAAGVENTLFLNYCLYEFNHVLNEFEDNYARLIMQVRDKHAVKQYLESEGAKSE